MIYNIKQFRYCKSNKTFYSDVKTLGSVKFSKKKFVIKNNKTKVAYAFVSVREYYNAYMFRSKSKLKQKLFVVIFKPGFNKNDRKDISPVKHLKIYPTDIDKKYKVVFLTDESVEVTTKYSFDTRMLKANMQDLYAKIGVKRYIDISIQNYIDRNLCYNKFLALLNKQELIKQSHIEAVEKWGNDCPGFILKHKYTLEVWNEESFLYRWFYPLIRLCPIQKMKLKYNLLNN